MRSNIAMLRSQLQLLLASLAAITMLLRSYILMLLLASLATTVIARFAGCNNYAAAQHRNYSCCSLRSLQ